MLVQMPPVKNFTINEKDRGAIRDTLAGESGVEVEAKEGFSGGAADEGVHSGSTQRKNFIIVTIIVILAALFAVGIYFAIDLSNASN